LAGTVSRIKVFNVFFIYSYKTVLCLAPGYVFIKFTIMEPHNFELSYNIEGTTEKYFSGAFYLKSLGTMLKKFYAFNIRLLAIS
jgi:hypothetical protein